ncbi:MAG: hypothetical protein KJ070_16695 [Verrucomicrobia bacterium]|nr:hypothetical protein [Verrucomicrobiota bacterium]
MFALLFSSAWGRCSKLKRKRAGSKEVITEDDEYYIEWITPETPPYPPVFQDGKWMSWEEAFGPLPKPEPIAVKRPKNPKPPEPIDPQKQWVEIKRKLAPWMTEDQLRAAPAKTAALEVAQRRATIKGGFVPKVDPTQLRAETKKRATAQSKSDGFDDPIPMGGGGGGNEPESGGGIPTLHLVEVYFDPQGFTRYTLWVTDAPSDEWFELYFADELNPNHWVLGHSGLPDGGFGTSVQEYLMFANGHPQQGFFRMFPFQDSDGDGANWTAPCYNGCFGSTNDAIQRIDAIKLQGTNILIGGTFFNDGSAGNLNYIAKGSDGINWVPLGDGLEMPPTGNDGVFAIELFGSDIYIGGAFTNAGGDGAIQFVSRLVGTNWTKVGNGLTMPEYGAIRAIASIGDTLYIGGDFTAAGGDTNIHHVAKLVGTNWVGLGTGVDGPVRTFAVRNKQLIVGGEFESAGGDTNANRIAIWDRDRWEPVGRGLARTPEDLWNLIEAPPIVQSIAVYCDTLYVGGSFTLARNDNAEVAANHVAKAAWNPETQTWVWSPLGTGLGPADDLAEATAVVIREVPAQPGYQVVVGGAFYEAGSQPVYYGVARWIVGSTNVFSTNMPSVTITSPTNHDSFVATNTITFTAVATAHGTNTLFSCEFFVDGVSYSGQMLASPDTNSETFTIDWMTPAPVGVHIVTAVVRDNAGPPLGRASAPVFFNVSDNSLVPVRDTYTIFSDGFPTNLNVLANDTGTGPLRITDVSTLFNPFTAARLGYVRVGYGATNLVYQTKRNSFGTEVVDYSVTDGNQTNSTYATVIIKSRPAVDITFPPDDLRTNAPASFTIDGTALDYDGAVSNVKLFLDGVQYGSQVTPTGNSFSFTFSTNVPGFYTFYALATDNEGYTNASPLVTVNVYNTLGSAPPIADISNLSPSVTTNHGVESIVHPVIRDGLFDLTGSAYDPDHADDAYAILLYRPDDPDNVFANVTPGTLNAQGFRVGAVTNGALGTLDLSTIPNGIYDLALVARGGGEETFAIVRVSLETELKVGRFTFSEQDLVIPVNGLPLTLVRTYDSFNPVEGEFGFNWTYAINDMDVVIDEDRQTVAALEALDQDTPLDKSTIDINLRVGGGRNITLTLPDGTRTTFRFTFTGSAASGEDCPGCVDAQWIAAPGVLAKLTTPNPATLEDGIGDNTLIPLPGFGFVWQGGGLFTPMEAFDFPKFILTMQDGTRYEITRDLPGETLPTYIYQDFAEHFAPTPKTYYIKPHPGKPRLSRIIQRTQDSIEINTDSIVHRNPSNQVTRTVWFERDDRNRIIAIRDPIEGANGTPVVKYVYNEDTGNLIQVHRLQNRTTGNYTITKYRY